MSASPRIALVVSRFNRAVTDNLLDGALAAAEEAGVSIGAGDVYAVPGAFELPIVAQALSRCGR